MIHHYPPGRTATNLAPGDFFLIHHAKGPIRRLIQLVQRLHFPKQDARWNHCGVFIHPDGTIVEALTSNVTQGNISKYQGFNYVVVGVTANTEDRDQMVAFCEWALGREYGFLTDLSLLGWCLFGGKFSFGLDGEMCCSGLVARALERAGYIFDRDSSHVMPADLARKFNVTTIQ